MPARMKKLYEIKLILKELLVDSVLYGEDLADKREMLDLHSRLVLLTQYSVADRRR